MKRLSILFPLAVSFLVLSCPTLASTRRTIYVDQAEGINGPLVTLQVGPAYGLSIIIPDGRAVTKEWLDDQSHFGLSSDGNLCQWSPTQEQNCTNTSATLIRVRLINLIHSTLLPSSPDGSTLLTMLVNGPGGREVYQFKLVPIPSLPSYTVIDIKPSENRPTPLLPIAAAQQLPTRTPSNTGFKQQTPVIKRSEPSRVVKTKSAPIAAHPVTPTSDPTALNLHPTETKTAVNSVAASTTQASPIDDANAVAYGLLVAKQKGQIKPHTSAWGRVQDAIIRLRRGESRQEAAREADLQMSILNRLIVWGQTRP